ncbi:MAG: TonB-dependent receptor [Bacteroidetes bacterium]|nr:TonB-dependent receptor [Bacteroidota bacterium]
MNVQLLLVFTLFILSASAQKYTISGYVVDRNTGEKLIGTAIFEKNAGQGTTSNTYGFYSLTLPEDSVNIIFHFVGYSAVLKRFHLHKDIVLNIEMEPSLDLTEVEINVDDYERIEQQSTMSTIKIPVEQIKALPALLGEVDVLKALQLLPGVQSGVEGTSGFYVRGGGPDQNLILLDGTPVYNANHLFGFFSVFNADAINSVELIKGGFPARYGGRLSSVIDINLKEGNMKKYQGSGSIGIVASKLTLEGPIIKDKSSFIVSARRTYIDVLLQPFIRYALNQGSGTKAGYYFYDLNAKINYKFSDKDRLYLSLYTGDDKFYFRLRQNPYLYDGVLYENKLEQEMGWGNVTSALRWNHKINKKLFSNTGITYSRYNFSVSDYREEVVTDTAMTRNIFSLKYLSGIEDWAGKVDFDYVPNPKHYLKFGIHGIYHTFRPGASTLIIQNPGITDIDSTSGAEDVYATEYSTYIEDDIKFTKRLKGNLGVHYSGFYVNSKLYQSLQPRIALRYLIGKSWAIKASYSTMEQYIHLLTNTSIGLPTDLWVPSTENIKPQSAQQVALGIAKTFKKNIQLSIEGYYKNMDNILEYSDGATFLNNNEEWDTKVEVGKGWSYGGEFFLQKKTGNTTGWIGYTLSWTNRQFDNINFGKIYPYKYDRRHDISVVFSHLINDRWAIAGTWVYGTGNAITLPIATYTGFANDTYYGLYGAVEYYENKNDYRMASYHRMDFSAKYKFLLFKQLDSEMIMGVYNLYNRKNPLYYYFGYDAFDNKALKRVSLFPFIPSLSLNFKF